MSSASLENLAQSTDSFGRDINLLGVASSTEFIPSEARYSPSRGKENSKNMFGSIGLDQQKFSKQSHSAPSGFAFERLFQAKGRNVSHLQDSFDSTSEVGSVVSGTAAGNSKAVLAALKALQDKIKRLEIEKVDVVEELNKFKSTTQEKQAEADLARSAQVEGLQKTVAEARAAYETLAQQKRAAENKSVALEDKIKILESEIDVLHTEVGACQDRLTAEHDQVETLESRLKAQSDAHEKSVAREKEITQTIVWETKRHEDEKAQMMMRIRQLMNELSRFQFQRDQAEARKVELDAMVKQLLSVNATLVGDAHKATELEKHHHHYRRHHHAKHHHEAKPAEMIPQKKHHMHAVATDYDMEGHHHNHEIFHIKKAKKKDSESGSVASARGSDAGSIKKLKSKTSVMTKNKTIKPPKPPAVATKKSSEGIAATGKKTAGTTKKVVMDKTKTTKTTKVTKKRAESMDDSSVASYTSSGSYVSGSVRSVVSMASRGSKGSRDSGKRLTRHRLARNQREHAKTAEEAVATARKLNANSSVDLSHDGSNITVHLPSPVSTGRAGIALVAAPSPVPPKPVQSKPVQPAPQPPQQPPQQQLDMGHAAMHAKLSATANAVYAAVPHIDSDMTPLSEAERLQLLQSTQPSYANMNVDAALASYDVALAKTDEKLASLNDSLNTTIDLNRSLATGDGLLSDNVVIGQTGRRNLPVPLVDALSPIGINYGAPPPLSSINALLLPQEGPVAAGDKTLGPVIRSLEEEFKQLNNQYRRLLTSVQKEDNAETKEAEELVSVINKLHRKGEQLRKLRVKDSSAE